MKPLDPRLLRHAAAARGYVALTAALGLVLAALVVAQALLIAHTLGPAVDGTGGDPRPLLAWLAAVVALRAAVTGLQERYAHRAAARVVRELREQVLTRAMALGPRWLADGRGPEVVTLATRGLADLEPYFVRYLPQLLLAATVTPATLLVVLDLDLVSAVTIAATLPLIPVFMWLIGTLTQGYAERRLATMQRLGAQVLDLLAGLPTLIGLGRERGPGLRVKELGDAHRRATMGTLRVAFLSGMVLELLTTLSVALVAVGIGMRLVYSQVDLVTALAVLVLAPEVYLPLRQVGTHYHASTDGIAAAQRVFAVLDEPLPERGALPAPDLRRTAVVLDGVAVRTADRWAPAPVHATLLPGRVTAVVGANGAGKSTAVLVLLSLLAPDRGAVRLRPLPPAGDPGDPGDGDRGLGGDDTSLADVDQETWWRQVAWVPQRPEIVPGTVLDNVLGLVAQDSPALDPAAGNAAGGDGTAGQGAPAEPAAGDDVPGGGEVPAAVVRAARLTGLDAVVAALPDGWATTLGHGGVGLSLGQRQRLALTRALLGDAQLVVLDEPSAHLDAAAERAVLDVIAELRAQRRSVLVVAHRASLVQAADEVVAVHDAPITPPDGSAGLPADPTNPADGSGER